MKHEGKCQALYITKSKIVKLVPPGGKIQKEWRLGASHANDSLLVLVMLHLAHDAAGEAILKAPLYQEAITLALVHETSATYCPVTQTEFDYLTHALGSSHESPTCGLGWRNYFCSEHGDPIWDSLVAKGLADEYARGWYRATEKGCLLAGVHPDEAGFVARGAR